MELPTKYVAHVCKSRRMPVLFPQPLAHSIIMPSRLPLSAGFARRVSTHGIQAYGESDSLGLKPHEDDSLLLSAMFLGMLGPVQCVMVELHGVAYPVISLLSLGELCRGPWPSCITGVRACGSVDLSRPGHADLMPVRFEHGGTVEPSLEDAAGMALWLADVLELRPIEPEPAGAPALQWEGVQS